MNAYESENALKELKIIIDRRVKGHQIDFLEIENLGYIESKVNQCIKSGLVSVPEINKKNAIAATYARAYINRQESTITSKKGYTSLTQYCRDELPRPKGRGFRVRKLIYSLTFIVNFK